ncbi:MAG: family 43 glycosylhydrolase, partial [Lachnospiraceae bacterium]|nr:family 43 glycosylhydrolase [Lachnospiraceae bacterium]
YAGWSAPIERLTEWRYEGVILEKGLDPLDPDGDKSYYAPDVVQGPDGRFYLYYSIENSGIISVAVCGQPAGKFKFYGHVKVVDGHVLGSSEEEPLQFDPAVLVDGERVYM